MRIFWQALGLGVLINVLAWVFIILTPADFPRLLMAPGFVLAWHAQVGDLLGFVILFGVNVAIWTVISLPFLALAKAWK